MSLSYSVQQEVIRTVYQLSYYQFSSLHSLSFVRLFGTPRTAASQASLSITNSQSLLRLMSVESVMPSNHLILCLPLLSPSIFPASGSFPMRQFFASGGQGIGALAILSIIKCLAQSFLLLQQMGSQTPDQREATVDQAASSISSPSQNQQCSPGKQNHRFNL